MNVVKVHFIYKGNEDEVIFRYEYPEEVKPMFEEWLEKRGLKLEDLNAYWGEQID